MMDDLATYMEGILRPDKKIIIWDSVSKKFLIFTQSIDNLDCVVSYTEFYAKYERYIKNSPYYVEYMAYVLGSHV